MDDVWPSHAYVPGKTPRHPEGAFDVVRASAEAAFSPDQLARCAAFRQGLRYLDAGFYWEAHELLEPVWMVLPEPSRERQFVQGLIQIANGFLKLEMDRPKAAGRLVAIARELIPPADQAAVMGLELADIHRMIISLDGRVKDAL